MAKSLQDQLLKAGLANKKQAVKAKKAKNTKEKMQRKGAEVSDELRENVAKADAEKLARDRELNRQRNAEAERRAVKAQIVQLVDMNKIETRGDIDFNFTHEGKIKTLMLEAAQRKALTNGQLAIVKTVDAPFELVHATIARKIAERDKDVLIVLNEGSGAEEAEDLDDAYADYKIPDDLMW